MKFKTYRLYKFLTVVFIFSICLHLLSACSKGESMTGIDTQVSVKETKTIQKQEPDPTPVPSPLIAPDPINTEGYGNNQDNISFVDNGGFAVQLGEKIYLQLDSTQSGIYSMNMDGTDFKLFRAGNYRELNAIENSLFFLDNNTIFRKDVGGNEFEFQVASGEVVYLCYYDGYLYYCVQYAGASTTYQMWRIRSDFSQNEVLYDFNVRPQNINIYETSIYYRDASGNEKGVFETNWVSHETRVVSQTSTNTLIIRDGCVITDENLKALKSTDIETGQAHFLQNTRGMSNQNILEKGRIYAVLNKNKKIEIVAYNLSDGMQEKIWSSDESNIIMNVAGDWLFIKSATGAMDAMHLPDYSSKQILNPAGDLTTSELVFWESYVIVWKDKNVENAIRIMLDKPKGNITFGETANIRKLYFWGNAVATESEAAVTYVGGYIEVNGNRYAYKEISSLEDLKWFPNLETLSFGIGRVKASFEPLSHLSHLNEMTLNSTEFSLFHPKTLGLLTQLRSLHIFELTTHVDLHCLEGMTSLEQLELETEFEDFSFISILPSLRTVSYCSSTGDGYSINVEH